MFIASYQIQCILIGEYPSWQLNLISVQLSGGSTEKKGVLTIVEVLLFTNVNINDGENVSISSSVCILCCQFQTTFMYVLVFSHWLIMSCARLSNSCEWHIISCARLSNSCERLSNSCARHINSCERLSNSCARHINSCERVRYSCARHINSWARLSMSCARDK